MFEPGLHAVHRTAFLTGVLAYASSPLWLAFLMLSTLLFAQHAGSDPIYFFQPDQLFPIWPTANFKLMLTLFGLTAVLLLAPKVMALIAIIVRGEESRFGGVARLMASAFIEFWHSLLLAPVRMLFHTQFVVAALTGWRLDWRSPPRDDAATSWREACARHGVHTLLAIAWIGAIVATSAAFPWWLSPILVGLLTAIPLSVLSSRTGTGRWLRARGLMLTPEESREPRVLQAARRASAEVARSLASFRATIVDPEVHGGVVAALPRRAAPHGERGASESRLVERALADGPAVLAAGARLRLLSSASALATLRREVLAHRAHPDWWRDDGVADALEAPRAAPADAAPHRAPSRIPVAEPL